MTSKQKSHKCNNGRSMEKLVTVNKQTKRKIVKKHSGYMVFLKTALHSYDSCWDTGGTEISTTSSIFTLAGYPGAHGRQGWYCDRNEWFCSRVFDNVNGLQLLPVILPAKGCRWDLQFYYRETQKWWSDWQLPSPSSIVRLQVIVSADNSGSW